MSRIVWPEKKEFLLFCLIEHNLIATMNPEMMNIESVETVPPLEASVPTEVSDEAPLKRARKNPLLCWKCGGEHKSTECPQRDTIEGWPFRPVDHVSASSSILEMAAYDLASTYLRGFPNIDMYGFPFMFCSKNKREKTIQILPQQYNVEKRYKDRVWVGVVPVVVDSLRTLSQYKNGFKGIFFRCLHTEDAKQLAGILSDQPDLFTNCQVSYSQLSDGSVVFLLNTPTGQSYLI